MLVEKSGDLRNYFYFFAGWFRCSGCPCCFLDSFCQCCYCLFDVFGSFQWDIADYFALDYFFKSLPFGGFIA